MLTEELENYQLQRNSEISVVIQITQLLRPQIFLLPYKENNIKDKIDLVFNDSYQTSSKYEAPGIQEQQAKQIIEFFNKHIEDADLLIVASDKCTDRSNAVVKAIADFYNQDIQYLNIDRYNTLVYNTIYDQLKLNTKLNRES